MIKRLISLLTLTFTLLLACNGNDILGGSNGVPAVGNVDSEITEQDAQSQDFNLKTPGFEMQVAIRSDVGGNTDDMLNLHDERAADFLECQFGNSQVGSEEFQIPSGETIPPLSALGVFVVPFIFKCNTMEAANADCGGIFFPDSDLINRIKRESWKMRRIPAF